MWLTKAYDILNQLTGEQHEAFRVICASLNRIMDERERSRIEAERLRQENERLQAALEEIRDLQFPADGRPMKIARAALGTKYD